MHKQFIGLENIKDDDWEEYKKWNLAICNYYYSGRFENRPVYLDLDKEIINELYKENINNEENEIENFTNAIIKTIKYSLENETTAFEKHLKLARSWKYNSYEESPPFLALLAMFTFVAETMIASDGFSSNNYYGRLTNLLDVKQSNKRKIEEGYKKCIAELWPLINNWLETWDGMLGYPTAKSIDTRKYVSVSISQALVREHDRKLMHSMFKDEELTPANNIQPSEMFGLMRYWLDSKHPNRSITRMINKDKNIADRVVEIAIDELQAWDGLIEESSQNKGISKIKLMLVAELRNNPSDEINLYFSTWTYEGILADKNYLPSKNIELGTAFDEITETLTLKKLEGLNFLSLEPWTEIKPGDALLSKFILEPVKSKAPNLYRDGHELNILAFQDEDSLYKEVKHVPLMGRLMILCHESIANKVNTHLIKAATPGFKKKNSDEINNLPNFWVLFTEVYIINSIETPGLEALKPLAQRTIVLDGGIKLERDVWLTGFPPEILLAETIIEDELSVYIEKELDFSENSKKILLGNFKKIINIDLTNQNIIDGDYRITVQNNNNEILNKVTIKFRSSNFIRPNAKIEKELIIHRLRKGFSWGAISGEYLHLKEEVDVGCSANQIDGANIEVDFELQEISIDKETILTNKIESSEENIKISRRTSLLSDQKEISSCIGLGYHTWLYGYIPPYTKPGYMIKVECSSCGIKFIDRYKVSHKNTPAAKNTKDQNTELNIRSSNLPTILRKIEIKDFRPVLEAMNYWKVGNLAKVKPIVSQITDESWVISDYLYELSSFGYINFKLDIKTFKIDQWSIAKNVFVKINEEEIICTGGFPVSKLDFIRLEVEKMNGVYESDWGHLRVPIIKLKNITDNNLKKLSDIFSIPIIENYGLKLLTLLPNIKEIINVLPTIKFPLTELEFFNYKLMKWEESEDVHSVGLYRSSKFGARYIFVNEENVGINEGYLGDVRTMKHLVAQYLGKTLISFNEYTNELTVPLGCDLPCLYERAIVVQSGFQPVKNNGFKIYKFINKNLAYALISKFK